MPAAWSGFAFQYCVWRPICGAATMAWWLDVDMSQLRFGSLWLLGQDTLLRLMHSLPCVNLFVNQG
jgi:hypothetical protein